MSIAQSRPYDAVQSADSPAADSPVGKIVADRVVADMTAAGKTVAGRVVAGKLVADRSVAGRRAAQPEMGLAAASAVRPAVHPVWLGLSPRHSQ